MEIDKPRLMIEKILINQVDYSQKHCTSTSRMLHYYPNDAIYQHYEP